MTAETKICQNCKTRFTIEPDDFDFYKKINVTPPTWCPGCRQERRYAWRNERILYRRNCDLCDKSTVTIYSPNKPYKVYCPPCWWSDQWSAFDYARDFDFSRSFFEQWHELQLLVPRIALLTKNSTNSEYANHSNNNKNCYLSFSVFNSENILYSNNVWEKSQDCCDCYLIATQGTLLYQCIDTEKSYRCQYGILLRDCTNCYYCYDCHGCSDCFLSSNLRNKQYCILNVQYSKDEYLKKLKEYSLGSYASRQQLEKEFFDLMQNRALRRFAVVEQSNDATGNMIFNSKNVHHVFEANNTENTKYGVICPSVKDSMDSYHYGFECELIYESHALIHDYNVSFTHMSYDNSHLMYCDSCHNSQNLFGCVGIRQGTYCILNKRYEENEFKTLKEKIIDHMKTTGEFGEFFPAQLSPFGYNETQGQIYAPLTKDQAARRGWKWEDQTPGTFGKETIKPQEIPDDIAQVKDAIINEILVCSACEKNFNIVKPELDFYRRENITIPRECPNCRYIKRINLRLPRKLWHSKCRCAGQRSENGRYNNSVLHFHGQEHCPNEFETSYALTRPETIYCEACYNSEVV
jgi:hypothetical protein